MGLAAAMTEQRACSCVTMPALEMEMDCCSMACAAHSSSNRAQVSSACGSSGRQRWQRLA